MNVYESGFPSNYGIVSSEFCHFMNSLSEALAMYQNINMLMLNVFAIKSLFKFGIVK